MAVVTTKSGWITDRDATPPVNVNANLNGASLKSSFGKVTAVSGDSIGSKYVLCSIPSNARVSQLLLTCTAITTCAGDIGLYKSTKDGGAVVDADFFASAQSLAAALSNSDVTRESGVVTEANTEKMLWQQLGLTSDPGLVYDVVVTLTAAAGSGGTVAAEAIYAI